MNQPHVRSLAWDTRRGDRVTPARIRHHVVFHGDDTPDHLTICGLPVPAEARRKGLSNPLPAAYPLTVEDTAKLDVCGNCVRVMGTIFDWPLRAPFSILDS